MRFLCVEIKEWEGGGKEERVPINAVKRSSW
jgi:hypothetical protein